ncbi:C9ORF3 [Acanthosepion pharaonis]|uniref:C9ORF3 n=1 Tax=Acanthosepion pharaonis TaxID=158019 RepID=A0A812BD54_ACAPH|nr:C9ORF3 [Sepia pharaonis]
MKCNAFIEKSKPAKGGTFHIKLRINMEADDQEIMDLPMMSNRDISLVTHYIIDLSCDMKSKSFTGSITLFMQPAPKSTSLPSGRKTPYVICSSNFSNQNETSQDACNIHVSQVKLLELPNCDKCTKPCLKCRTANVTQLEKEKFFRFCSSQPGQNLRFSTTKWSLNIWDERQPPERFDARLPFVVRIEYSTLPEGKSLKWVADQDGNMTVFTRGDFINNRSLFPSQDHPETLSTWQAYITVTVSDVVLMTGDQEAVVTQQENAVLHLCPGMLMPSSTVAIAVGQWQILTICESESLVNDKREKWVPDFCSSSHHSCSVNFSQHPILPCRVFAPKSLLAQVEAEFQHYLPKCLAEMHNVFGPHPFCRLDILLVPSCFESLGMANPCLIFLSESILVGNCSFCCRLSHEISHSWFGLVLGPKDWTEEWMTEGFASFVEDLVHPKVIGMNEKEAEDWFELRALIKYRVLTAELSHTNDELQIMRINESDAVANKTEENGSVKNGLNPDKKCLQVHYLKGYFLLRFFSQKVGLPHFKIFLRKYVHHFHGQLVSSQDFLQLLFKEFPKLRFLLLSTLSSLLNTHSLFLVCLLFHFELFF